MRLTFGCIHPDRPLPETVRLRTKFNCLKSGQTIDRSDMYSQRQRTEINFVFTILCAPSDERLWQHKNTSIFIESRIQFLSSNSVEVLIYRTERSQKAIENMLSVADLCHFLGNWNDHIESYYIRQQRLSDISEQRCEISLAAWKETLFSFLLQCL